VETELLKKLSFRRLFLSLTHGNYFELRQTRSVFLRGVIFRQNPQEFIDHGHTIESLYTSFVASFNQHHRTDLEINTLGPASPKYIVERAQLVLNKCQVDILRRYHEILQRLLPLAYQLPHVSPPQWL
jgi:hypothetical protein